MLEVEDSVASQIQSTLDELATMDGVAAVNQPRFWPNEAETLVGSVHIQARDGTDTQDLRRRVTEILKSHIDGLKEVCVQVEYESAAKARLRATMQQQQTPGFFYNRSSSPFQTSVSSTAVHQGTAISHRTMLPPQPTVAMATANADYPNTESPLVSQTPPPSTASPLPGTPAINGLAKKQTKKE